MIHRLMKLLFRVSIIVFVFAEVTFGQIAADSTTCGVIKRAHTDQTQQNHEYHPAVPGGFDIRGVVFDCDTKKPVPFVTVQQEGTGRSTLTNEQGEYRIIVANDSGLLKFSHISYYSEKVNVTRSDTQEFIDIYLRPTLIEIPGFRVYGKNYNPAEQIIIEAIKRKKDILAKLKKFNCDAYTKMIVRDRKKPDSSNIFLITESQVTCLWEQPDKYKEIITARKQSSNLKADQNLVSVGQILNFNENRIGPDLVSPTATDALDYYHYYLLDTIEVDNQKVFVIEIEPKNDVDRLFKGTIHIADSTYDIVGVDVGISSRFLSPIIQKPQYSQKCARFNNNIWMPVEIRFSFDFKLKVPIPGIPSDLAIRHIASLSSYSFDKPSDKWEFDEYALEVIPVADNKDSSFWNTLEQIPLTQEEKLAYKRIDSVEHAPKPILKQLPAALLGVFFMASFQNDLFHFNRAEGLYFGLGGKLRDLIPHGNIRLKAGYAVDGKIWQQAIGFNYRLSEKSKFEIGAEFHNEVVHSPTIVLPQNVNMTIPALFSISDPLDYYRERGFSLSASAKLLKRTKLGLTYRDYKQWSTPLVIDSTYISFFDSTRAQRDNPLITDGKLRSLSADFFFDSRSLFKNKTRIDTVGELSYTQFAAGIEYASPSFFHNDFDFRRYHVSLFTNIRLLDLGMTSLHIYAGGSDQSLPRQRYFTIEGCPLALFIGKGFQTLNDANFSGKRVLSLTAQQDFGHRIFGKCGIPLVNRIPFTVGIHGGVFWSDFTGHPNPPAAGINGIQIAKHPYSELGFSLGNMTPFMSPFNFKFGFTWQLSHYDTNKFAISWGFSF